MLALDSHALEARRQAVQIEIDARKSSVERNRLGQFATPNTLAVDITRYVASLIPFSLPELHFADPSIGSGSFFSAALAIFGPKRLRSALGIELDPAFADAAHTLWSEAGLEIISGDFTRIVAGENRPARPNLVLANPPYVRHHHFLHEEKERLQQLVFRQTGLKVSGLAGLYAYFLLLATAWMEDDGIAAWLIPSEFMDVNYGEVLRCFLADHVTLLRLHRFDPADVQFGDALVSSAVLIFRKTPPTADHSVEFSFSGSLAAPRILEQVPVARLRMVRKWTSFPVHIGNDRHATRETSGPALGNFFRIQRGIATGCNEFFILDRTEAKRLGLPEKYLRPILPSPRHLKSVQVEADADGYPHLDRQLCLIDCDLPEALLESRYPKLWAYLQTAESLGHRTGYLLSKRSPWYKQEQRAPAPFLCTYMGRGTNDKQPFRFIWNRSRAIGTNLYLMLTPTIGLAAMLAQHPERFATLHDLLARLPQLEGMGDGSD